ncbi:hypothetical protein UZ36_00500 [Candidatus Nitromaritima sp. SCGC AAA799-C22]|nr:hypothetical protein UZ36_00500 [Candidatus Nitromaritima sp. SCGC AAA799-C22]
MSNPSSPQIMLTHYDWSLARLKEALEKEDTEYYRGAALQRLGLTCDLVFKTIRAFAGEQDKTLSTHESCFEWAARQNWLENDTGWKKIMTAYVKIQNRPTGASADQIYTELPEHFQFLKHLRDRMPPPTEGERFS